MRTFDRIRITLPVSTFDEIASDCERVSLRLTTNFHRLIFIEIIGQNFLLMYL